MMQMSHLLVVDGDESHLPQALTLHAVVHDVAQTIELGALGQFLLGLPDSCRHAKAETTAFVNLDIQHLSLNFLFIYQEFDN